MSRGPGQAAPGFAGAALQLLPLAGLLVWFIVGLPWGPHAEAFDWIVRFETMPLGQAALEKLPSVGSVRPLGIGLAGIAYRLGGHDVALPEFVNAALSLLAWWWLGRAVLERRSFALFAMVAGGVFFAGYVYVFHIQGVFYAPLLLYVAALVHLARRPPGPGALVLALAATVLGACFHPFALPIAVAFAAGAVVESRALRSGSELAAAGALVAGSIGLYLLLVPAHARISAGDPLLGWRASFATTELNRMVALAAGGLAVLSARGLAGGRARPAVVALVAAVAAGLIALRWPVLPLWFAVVALSSVLRGRWALAAVLAACVVLPAANPTGSPTYVVFATFLAAALTAMTAGIEERLGWLGAPVAAVLVALALALGIALRAGVPIPVVSAAARPLAIERERTAQFPVIVRRYLASDWAAHPLRFARRFDRPTEGDAVDRRYRPPTTDVNLATWLAHLRAGAPTAGETLYVAFGADPLAVGEVVLTLRGRAAGDALVFRRAPAATAEAPRAK